MSLIFNKYLQNMTHVLSNGRLKHVSLLDLPGFGSMMIDSFENPYCDMGISWSSQVNMEIYHSVISSLNESYKWDIWDKCREWKAYMDYPEANDFPLITKGNQIANFTYYIAENMNNFLIAYASSTLSISKKNGSTAIWSDIAKKVFMETKSEDFVDFEDISLYDKLIMDCVFQEPLLSHKHKECTKFQEILTSNGLCYGFNGDDRSKI